MVLPALLFALLIASSTAWAEEAPDQQTLLPSSVQVPTPELNLFDVVSGATVAQRARMSRLLANKYPALSKDLSTLLTEKYPQVLSETTAYVEHLVRTKYPEIPGLVLDELQAAPAVQSVVEKLIDEKYPNLITEIAEVADADDLRGSVAQLIQQQHPELVTDVLTVITGKFPSLLTRLQHQVLSNHPGILVDVADMIQRSYPGFTNDVFVLIFTEYPDLVSEVLATLNEAPTTDAAGTVEGGSVDLQGTSSVPDDEVPNAEEAAGTTASGASDVAKGE